MEPSKIQAADFEFVDLSRTKGRVRIPEGYVSVNMRFTAGRPSGSQYITFSRGVSAEAEKAGRDWLRLARNLLTGELYIVLSATATPDSAPLCYARKKGSSGVSARVTSRALCSALKEHFRLEEDAHGVISAKLYIGDNISNSPSQATYLVKAAKP